MLNEALRLIRVYHDLSQKEAAERVKLSKSYLSELEAGNKKVTLEVLEKYSTAFDLPISSLMLFAEQAASNSLAERARVKIAGKVIKMLEWIEMLTESNRSEHSRQEHSNEQT